VFFLHYACKYASSQKVHPAIWTFTIKIRVFLLFVLPSQKTIHQDAQIDLRVPTLLLILLKQYHHQTILDFRSTQHFKRLLIERFELFPNPRVHSSFLIYKISFGMGWGIGVEPRTTTNSVPEIITTCLKDTHFHDTKKRKYGIHQAIS
jgi:hypothetical protein